MTQTLNKAFKMSSLFKDFNQTPLADYGNVLAGFEILAFSSKLSAEPILGHSENFKKKKKSQGKWVFQEMDYMKAFGSLLHQHGKWGTAVF